MERLRRSADFTRVQSAGRRVRGVHFQLVVAPGGSSATRCGFAVSRKVGNAVVRNRVKRWLREATRSAWIPLSPRFVAPLDLVFIARPGTGDAGFRPVVAEVTDLLERAAGLAFVVTSGHK